MDLDTKTPPPAAVPTPVASSSAAEGSQTQGAAVAEQSAGAPAPAYRVRPGFGAARLDLTPQEFENPITAKFLYRDADRLEAELADAKPYVSRCAEVEKAAAVLEQKLASQRDINDERDKNQRLADICFGVGVGIGGVMLGVTPSFANSSGISTTAIIIGALGLALIIGGIVVKVVKK